MEPNPNHTDWKGKGWGGDGDLGFGMDLEPGKDLELKPSILPPSPGSWQSKNQKKQRSAALLRAQEDFGAVPHSFVFHRGRVGRNVRQLSMDLRRVMEPYTARALKVSGGGG